MLTSDTLKSALEAANLTRLAARCGLDRKTLQRIRDGENSPTLKNAESIAQAMRVLASEDGKPDPFPDLPLPLAVPSPQQNGAGTTDEPPAPGPGGPASAEAPAVAAVKEAA